MVAFLGVDGLVGARVALCTDAFCSLFPPAPATVAMDEEAEEEREGMPGMFKPILSV